MADVTAAVAKDAVEASAGHANGAAAPDTATDAPTESQTKESGDPKAAVQSTDQKGHRDPPEKHDKNDKRGSKQDGKGTKYQRRRDGSKADYSALPESSDPEEIRKQVEFYFSDANLARDRFLFEQTGGPKNSPVPVKTIHSFKRMRRFQPFSAVVAALRESPTLIIAGGEDDDKEEAITIRRKVPFAADAAPDADHAALLQQFEDASLARSVHVRGFGTEQPTTQFDVEAFLAAYGPTNQVRLRRYPDKTFKGTVLVEFDSEETAKHFLAADPAPEYKGKKLLLTSKKAWLKEKAEQEKRHASKRGTDDRDWRARREDDRRKEKGDDRDWRVRREEDRKKGFRDDRKGGHHRDGRRGDRKPRDTEDGDDDEAEEVAKDRHGDEGVGKDDQSKDGEQPSAEVDAAEKRPREGDGKAEADDPPAKRSKADAVE